MILQATCYARFSSQEQASGSSLERQFELTAQFATSRGWDVAPERCISDEGRSAYHGINRTEGSALFKFENEAERGVYRSGHVLVVEHLDRVSRQGFQETYDFLNKLTSQGVTIALVDGPTIYERYTRIDMAEIMRVLIKSELAREESEKKRNRQLYTWEKKLAQVRRGERLAITKLVPEWVEVDPQTREMRANEYRAEIVREIFQLCIDGYGSPAIANRLNARGEDTWAVYSKDDPKGRYKAGDKRAGRGWTISYINRLLQNPAVTGEYRPMQRARSSTLAVAKGERFLDYYPRVVDPAVFAEANAAREDRRRKGGKLWAQQVNLFSGLARCSVCNDKMGYVGTRKAGQIVNGTNGTRKPIRYVTGTDTNYLMCNSARRNYRCSNRKRIRYEHLEKAVLDNLLHLALDDTHFEVADRVADLHVEIADRANRLNEKSERLARLVDGFSRTGSPAIEHKLLELEREIAADTRKLESLRSEYSRASGAVSPVEHRKRIERVRGLLSNPDHDIRLEARRKVHQALRAILTIQCSPEQISTVVLANGLAAFRVNMAGQVLDQFNLSDRPDLHNGLSSGELARNKLAVDAVVRRTMRHQGSAGD